MSGGRSPRQSKSQTHAAALLFATQTEFSTQTFQDLLDQGQLDAEAARFSAVEGIGELQGAVGAEDLHL